MMTRTHYESLAALARELPHFVSGPAADGAADPDALKDNVRRGAAEMLAAFCAADNPRFDREKFMRACGVTS